MNDLKDKNERLRSIGRVTDWWTHFMKEIKQIETPGKLEDPLLFCHQAVEGDLRNRSLLKDTGESAPNLSHLSIYPCRTGMGPAKGAVHQRRGEATCSRSPIWKPLPGVIVGDLLLKGTERPMCRVDLHHWEVCSLPGTQIREITGTLPSLVYPTD